MSLNLALAWNGVSTSLILALSLVLVACKGDTKAPPSPQTVARPSFDAGITATAPGLATDAARLAPGLATDAAPAATPRALHLVLLHEHELLASEKRAILRLTKRLRGVLKGPEIETSRATGAFARDVGDYLTSERTEIVLPAEFAATEVVIVLALATPRQSDSGKPISTGVAGHLLFQRPFTTPVFSARMSQSKRFNLEQDGTVSWGSFSEWLSRFVAATLGDQR